MLLPLYQPVHEFQLHKLTGLHVYVSLIDNQFLTNSQQIALQQLAFFLGVKEYNQQNFKVAISYFNVANKYPVNDDYSYLTNYWLADCYFQLSDFDK